MNMFNRKRFAHYVKWDICNQRSKETQVFGILLLSFTLIMLMLFIDTSSVTEGMHLTAFLREVYLDLCRAAHSLCRNRGNRLLFGRHYPAVVGENDWYCAAIPPPLRHQ